MSRTATLTIVTKVSAFPVAFVLLTFSPTKARTTSSARPGRANGIDSPSAVTAEGMCTPYRPSSSSKLEAKPSAYSAPAIM